MNFYKYVIVFACIVYSIVLSLSIKTNSYSSRVIKLFKNNSESVTVINNQKYKESKIILLKVELNSVAKFLLITNEYENPLSVMFKIFGSLLTAYFLINLTHPYVLTESNYNSLFIIIQFYAIHLLFNYFGALYTNDWYRLSGAISDYYYRVGTIDNNVGNVITTLFLFFLLNIFKRSSHLT